MSETYWIGVTGDFSSGKTAFIRSISEQEVVSVEFDIGMNTKLAFDFGCIFVGKDLYLDLCGNPGAYSADGVLRIQRPNLLGVVVMVNSAVPRSFPVARSPIATLSAYNPVHCIVAANPFEIGHYNPYMKQFGKSVDGWGIDDLRIILRVPDDIPIIPCVAVDKESVKRVLITLLEKVIEAIDAPDEP